jgi:hypothetical protein
LGWASAGGLGRHGADYAAPLISFDDSFGEAAQPLGTPARAFPTPLGKHSADCWQNVVPEISAAIEPPLEAMPIEVVSTERIGKYAPVHCDAGTFGVSHHDSPCYVRLREPELAGGALVGLSRS